MIPLPKSQLDTTLRLTLHIKDRSNDGCERQTDEEDSANDGVFSKLVVGILALQTDPVPLVARLDDQEVILRHPDAFIVMSCRRAFEQMEAFEAFSSLSVVVETHTGVVVEEVLREWWERSSLNEKERKVGGRRFLYGGEVNPAGTVGKAGGVTRETNPLLAYDLSGE